MYQAIKGTQDILPADRAYWRHVTEQMHSVATLFGLQQIDTPIFEDTGLFVRGVGEGTDIVDKEMYSFRDKGGTDVTLRPEFTAGVMRAYIEHGMHVLPQPVKLYSIGPIFRYDRPRPAAIASSTSSTSRFWARSIRPWISRSCPWRGRCWPGWATVA